MNQMPYRPDTRRGHASIRTGERSGTATADDGTGFLSGVAALALAAVIGLALSLAGPAAAAEPCPNQVLREEANSTALPQCRAYEQVTPPFKGGAHINLSPFLSASGIQAISAGGSPLVASSPSIWGASGNDPVGLTSGAYYELSRGEDGWAVNPLTPPSSTLAYTAPVFSAPLSVNTGIWLAATPSQPVTIVDLYLREADGAFSRIGPLAPAAASAGVLERGEDAFPQPSLQAGAGASADLSRVIFELDAPRTPGSQSYLWPGDETTVTAGSRPSLYEYEGSGHSGEGADVPSLLAVDDSGAQITQCGTELGGLGRAGEINSKNAVSAGGSTVFFTARAAGCAPGATGPAGAQLFARIGSPGTMQATVNVAAGLGCAASASCDVTGAVTYQGAAEDGSKVFFTAAQAGLVAGDADSTNVLYECELPGDAGSTPTPSGVVDACPDLKAVSVVGAGSGGAEVKSVVGVSEEGSRVYYVATGVTTSSPNGQGQVAQEGAPNLYVYEPDPADPGQYQTVFIATLPTASPGEAQITPEGRYLVFTSAAVLTPDDTSTVAQAFRYDSRTGELIRVSIGQEGFNSDGNTNSDPATLAPLVEGGALRRGTTISADGSYVAFQSNDALTPQVDGAIDNTYLWHDGEVSLISDGIDTNQNAGLIGIDVDGEDVFFTTADQLVRQDRDDAVDVYDARIDGGFPAPAAPSPCEGEGCLGAAAAAPAVSSPATATFAGPGNQPTPAPKCKKGAVRRQGRCVAKKAEHHKKQKKHHRRDQPRTSSHENANKRAGENHGGAT
jgi:hypothetical protein